MAHHTASRAGSGNFPSKNVVLNGRTGLPGPLCQFLLGRNGAIILITGEGSNHAGTGGPISLIRRDRGNYDAWGIEAENNGIGEPWSNVQLQAYYRLCAALLDLMGTNDVSRLVGHKEYTSRKIDPNGINMDEFRARVSHTLKLGRPQRYRQPVKLSHFKHRSRNFSVLHVKYKLINRKMGEFDMKADFRDYWGKHASNVYANWQRYCKVPATGYPDKKSLNAMYCNVVPEAVRLNGEGPIYLRDIGWGKNTEANKRVKTVLRRIGYGRFGLGLRTNWGHSAEAALTQFQKDIGSYVTGIPDKSSIEGLGFKVLD